jgi:hypothetical protein
MRTVALMLLPSTRLPTTRARSAVLSLFILTIMLDSLRYVKHFGHIAGRYVLVVEESSFLNLRLSSRGWPLLEWSVKLVVDLAFPYIRQQAPKR